MVANSGLPVAHAGGEERPAVGPEGVIKPQGLRHIRQTVSGDGPVGDVIMDLFRPHIVYVLGVVGASLRLAGTDELVWLEDDIANAALAHPGVFAAPGMDPVHHHPCHGLHAGFSLATRLALD